MNKVLKLLCMVSLLILTAVFSGCGNDGDKFVGKWTGLEHPKDPLSYVHQVEITKNGDNFIVKNKLGRYNPFGTELEWSDTSEDTRTAVLKDGRLLMDNVFQSASITYDEKNKVLIFPFDNGISLQKDDDGKILEKLKADAEPLATKKVEENKSLGGGFWSKKK